MKTALILALLLAGCASSPVLTCPDNVEPQLIRPSRMPECTEQLEGCFAYDGNKISFCQDGVWEVIK